MYATALAFAMLICITGNFDTVYWMQYSVLPSTLGEPPCQGDGGGGDGMFFMTLELQCIAVSPLLPLSP